MNANDYNTLAIILSILSLSLSFYLILKNLWDHRRKLIFELDELVILPIEQYENTEISKCTLISLQIFCINKSLNPISISYFEIVDDAENKYRCDILPSYHSHRFTKLIDTDDWYSKCIEYTSFPKNIGACSAELCIVKIVIPLNSVVKNFYAYTNHGARIDITKISEQLSLVPKSNNNKCQYRSN